MTAAERAIADVLTFRRFWGDAWAAERIETAALEIARHRSLTTQAPEVAKPARHREEFLNVYVDAGNALLNLSAEDQYKVIGGLCIMLDMSVPPRPKPRPAARRPT